MKNNSTIFYIVRHGESEWNAKGLVQGYAKGNSPLTVKGRKQAQDLAFLLKNIHFDLIVSSNAKRAQQTAHVLAESLSLTVKIDSQLRERSFGKYEGMPVNEFLSLYKDFKSLTPEEKFHYKLDENEESFAEGYARFSKTLLEINEQYPGKTVLIVTHGGMIRGLLIKNGYGDFNKVGDMDNCGYVKVLSNGKTFKIIAVAGLKSWNEDHPGLKKS